MIKIKKNQLWKSKTGGKIIKISHKASGNRHWSAIPITGKKAHHIHEGTLIKFYELL